MTSTAPWVKHLSRHKVYVQGAFENVYGERYLVYRKVGPGGYPGDKLFFTGDEVDWQPLVPLLGADFIWNDDEIRLIGGALFGGSARRDSRFCLGHPEIEVLRKVAAESGEEGASAPVSLLLQSLEFLEAALEAADYDEIKKWSDQARENRDLWFKEESEEE